ncbi:DUF1045 domain-containing protein [Pseudooceanicola sp.]|uniref:DUF1045 domain-containing protein n=1 Tax=Pseudooceanicola sp. TaxID=1914328 RepID=UPI0035C6B5D1
MTYTRYAIYYTPDPGPLADFGAAWLGWDIETGQERPHPEIPGLPRPIEEITRTPRKYGFHGTIKPPFHLAEGCTEDGLRQAALAACAVRAPVRLEGLALTRIGRFLALTPQGETGPLADLAAAMVRELDPFRAPPGETELARRRARRLSPRQEELLTQWGYPYVMEEFRFHLTLTGSLDGSVVEPIQARLMDAIAPLLDGPVDISNLSLVGELPDGRLRSLQRLPLGA